MDIRDFASKISDNMARLAGLFHFFEGRTGEIQADTVWSAIRIAEYYLSEFKRIFGKAPEVPEEQTHAFLLEDWLFEQVWKKGTQVVKKNQVRNYGPNPIRNRVKLNAALSYLINLNRISTFEDVRRTSWIQLNPAVYSQRLNLGRFPY